MKESKASETAAQARIADLEATVAAQAQEIGRLRATDAGTEIAPGVRLVWQRGDVGVLTFEPGATVPEEAGPEGAIVGVRWGLTGEQFISAVNQAAPAGYQDDAELEARLTRMRAAERAANPLTFYMPIDGLSTEAMIDGLRGMALGALRSLKDSGGRAVGLKLIVTEEP